MRLIYKYNSKLSIYTDDYGYMVAEPIKKKIKGKETEKHDNASYFPTLEQCLEEIYERRIKEKLINNKEKKDLKKIVQIIQKTKKEVKDKLVSVTK